LATSNIWTIERREETAMKRPLGSMPAQGVHAWEQLQKLTACRELLQRCCDEHALRHASRVEIDERQFTVAFFTWLDLIARNVDYRSRNCVDYFHFVFGALLTELLRGGALRAQGIPVLASQAPSDDIADWWPTGYVSTCFCIGTLQQIVRQECGVQVEPGEAMTRAKLWHSFRENVAGEPAIAMAYFDSFMGLEPNWRMPGALGSRPAAAARPKQV
jgi:hypothetical protein